MIIVFEFVISVIVLLGSGLLLYYRSDSTEVMTVATASISAVLTYWFVRRTNDAVNLARDNTINNAQQLPIGFVNDQAPKGPSSIFLLPVKRFLDRGGRK